MAKSLEVITEDAPSLDYIEEKGIISQKDNSNYKPPALDYFISKVKGKKRKEEMKAELEKVFSNYVEYLKKYSPAHRRGALLEQSYNLVPEENEIEGKDSKEVLQQRLYANPGRQYQYLNGVVGDKNKSKDIKYELGRAAKYTLKEGWPVLGAGAGWLLANRLYKKGTEKGLAGRLKGNFNKKFWQYLVPGVGPVRAGVGAGKFLAKEGLRMAWSLAKTPFMYAIGAYAAYKTIKYFIKRRKEKKLEHEEIERLEGIRNNMVFQNQMYRMEKPEFETA